MLIFFKLLKLQRSQTERRNTIYVIGDIFNTASWPLIEASSVVHDTSNSSAGIPFGIQALFAGIIEKIVTNTHVVAKFMSKNLKAGQI
jgi:hypothetical protein